MTPKEIAIQWFERVWNQRSRETVFELMAPDAMFHQEGGPSVQGPEAFLDFHDRILAAFPNVTLQILRAVGDEIQAGLHWQVSATHRGQFLMVAATGTDVTFSGMSFMTVADGKITEGWDCWDVGSLIHKLSSAAV